MSMRELKRLKEGQEAIAGQITQAVAGASRANMHTPLPKSLDPNNFRCTKTNWWQKTTMPFP